MSEDVRDIILIALILVEGIATAIDLAVELNCAISRTSTVTSAYDLVSSRSSSLLKVGSPLQVHFLLPMFITRIDTI